MRQTEEKNRIHTALPFDFFPPTCHTMSRFLLSLSLSHLHRPVLAGLPQAAAPLRARRRTSRRRSGCMRPLRQSLCERVLSRQAHRTAASWDVLRSRGRKHGAPSASSAAAAHHASSAPSERVRRRALACGEYRASYERARRRRIQQGGAGTRGDATASNGTVHAAVDHAARRGSSCHRARRGAIFARGVTSLHKFARTRRPTHKSLHTRDARVEPICHTLPSSAHMSHTPPFHLPMSRSVFFVRELQVVPHKPSSEFVRSFTPSRVYAHTFHTTLSPMLTSTSLTSASLFLLNSSAPTPFLPYFAPHSPHISKT